MPTRFAIDSRLMGGTHGQNRTQSALLSIICVSLTVFVDFLKLS
jgi:hypothetical protein